MNKESTNKLSVIAKRLEALGKDIKELADGISLDKTTGFGGEEEEVETLTEISNWLLQLKVDLDELIAEQGG